MKPSKSPMKFSDKFNGRRVDDTLQAYYVFLENLQQDAPHSGNEVQALMLDRVDNVQGQITFFSNNESDQKKFLNKVLKLAKRKNLTKIFLGFANSDKDIIPDEKQNELARQFKRIAGNLNIDLVDQIILSERSYFSFKDNGL